MYMRFADPLHSRRGAFLFIALFSCLQITIGFFLINGNGHDSVLSNGNIESARLIQSELVKGKSYISDAKTIMVDINNDIIKESEIASMVSAIEPASGIIDEDKDENDNKNEQDIITDELIKSLTSLSTLNERGM